MPNKPNAFLSYAALVTLLLTCLSGCVAVAHSQPADGDAVGDITPEALLAGYPAFAQGYEAYSPTVKEQTAFARLTANRDILVLFGTWCHDSQREVARLIKLYDSVAGPKPGLRLYAVDRQKTDPDGLAERYKLRYTPTFYLLEGKRVLIRVIERPTNSLGEDLAAGLRR